MNSQQNRESQPGNLALPGGACDCHAHVYGPFDQFPLPAQAPFQPWPASVEILERLWGAFGIERGVLIQGSAYGRDHRALLAAISRDRQNRRGVALVEPTTARTELKHLHANGVCGARINFVRHLNRKGFDEDACWQVVRRIEPLSWHLELHVDAADLEQIQGFVRESPVDVVIDHMGRVDAALAPSQAPFRALVELAKNPRCWVKLSGADRLAEYGALETVVPFARSLAEAAPGRVVWGTDWPHVNLKQLSSDEALFGLLAQFAPNESSLTRLLVDNPARLYGFSHSVSKSPSRNSTQPVFNQNQGPLQHMRTIVVKNIPSPDPALLQRLRQFGVATVHEAQGRTGLLAPYLRPIFPGAKATGSALTVLAHPGDNTMLHVAAEVCRPGNVIVIALSSENSDGMLGELLATSFRARGAVGVIVDAGCRDVAEMTKMGFPVWSKAVSAKGTVKATLGSVNVPVVCAGTVVHPGDAVLADDDGVVTVPQCELEAVLQAAQQREEREAEVRARLAAGELGLDIYSMRPKLAQLGLTYVDGPSSGDARA